MFDWLINRVIDAAMLWNRWRIRQPLLQAAVNTETVQTDLLQEILQKNSDTQIGLQYNFSGIKSIADYRRQVPVHDYDSLSPYINRQIDGVAALTNDNPIYYARTSGTTGRYKDIPLTQRGIQQVSLAQKQLAVSLWQDTGFFTGKVLGFAGKAEEGTLRNGCSYGSVSGVTYQSLSPVLAAKFAVPGEALALEDTEARYQVFALTVMSCDQLTGIVTANPSSVLKLVRLIKDHADNLLATLSGASSNWLTVDAKKYLPQVLARASTAHIDALTTLLKSQSDLTPQQIFPALTTVACWTGGSCGTAIRQLQHFLPGDVKFVEYGYGASEFMGAVNVDACRNFCIPQLNVHFYEFVLREDWEAEHPVFVCAQDLIPGQDYYVFVTTQSGLYRYNINDIVRVGDPVGTSPTIRFMQKGKGVTSITGEKLSEYQLIEAVDFCLLNLAEPTGGYIALANEQCSRYDLFVECVSQNHIEGLADAVDKKLCELNAEYDDKRASNRLATVRVFRLVDGACEQIKQWSIDNGVREAQYKPTVLDYSRNWGQKITPLLWAENGA